MCATRGVGHKWQGRGSHSRDQAALTIGNYTARGSRARRRDMAHAAAPWTRAIKPGGVLRDRVIAEATLKRRSIKWMRRAGAPA